MSTIARRPSPGYNPQTAAPPATTLTVPGTGHMQGPSAAASLLDQANQLSGSGHSVEIGMYSSNTYKPPDFCEDAHSGNHCTDHESINQPAMFPLSASRLRTTVENGLRDLSELLPGMPPDREGQHNWLRALFRGALPRVM
jgi:hypothetical protein